MTYGRLAADGLIPRRVLFGISNRWCVRISPDGKKLAWVSEHEGADNVWVAAIDDLGSARVITPFRKGSLYRFTWAYDARHLVVIRDVHGDENSRIHSVDSETGRVIDLAAAPGVRASIQQLSPRHPHHILIGLNDRDPARVDIHRIDVRTGDNRLVFRNECYRELTTDDHFAVRFARDDDGCWQRMKRGRGELSETLRHDDEEVCICGDTFFVLSARGRDTAALVAVDINTGAREVLASNPHADVERVLVRPGDRKVQAAGYTHARTMWTFIDPAMEVDFEALRCAEEGDISITSRSQDDRSWTVAFDRGDAPVRFYLYDRERKRAHRLFAHNWKLEGLRLAVMRPERIQTSDGCTLVSYLTLPPQQRHSRPEQPLPTVLLVHGGPHARDYWGHDREHQWLANRGYAVLSVNFRGSTGFGHRFLHAGRQQWGRRMQEDLDAAVEWAIKEKIAAPSRIAIMGTSYGGYATLAGLAFSPKSFACGVAFAGPSNLVSLVMDDAEKDSYWWIGDPRTPKGRRWLLERSPVEYVEWIEKPLLIAHGANDVRVRRVESDRMANAMRRHDKRVTYVLYHDEGHGLSRTDNQLSYYAIVEAFLARYIGGRAQPIGDELGAATYTVLAGLEHVPGLRAARERASQRPPSSA
jgi:dipeptidyl aminopeptidase/acylaminoacyl peptidase